MSAETKTLGTQMSFDNRFKNPDGIKFVPLVQDSVGQLFQCDCKKKQQREQQAYNICQKKLQQSGHSY